MLLSYKTTPHSLTGRSPAELLTRRHQKTALDLLRPDLRDRRQRQGLQQKLLIDHGVRMEPLPQPDEAAWAKNFRPGPRWVPAVAGEATSVSSRETKLADGSVWDRPVTT